MTTKLNEPIKERVLSTYEQIVQSSWREGEEKKTIRVIKNLAKKGFPPREIAEITEKSEAFVLEILQKEGLY